MNRADTVYYNPEHGIVTKELNGEKETVTEDAVEMNVTAHGAQVFTDATLTKVMAAKGRVMFVKEQDGTVEVS